jgi:hypothetical protein
MPVSPKLGCLVAVRGGLLMIVVENGRGQV